MANEIVVAPGAKFSAFSLSLSSWAEFALNRSVDDSSDAFPILLSFL